MQTDKKVERERFILGLENLYIEGDRGALASLRKGLGKEPGEVTEMFSIVYEALGVEPAQKDEKIYFLVASLFALWHQGRQGLINHFESSFGKTFKMINFASNSESIKKRFSAIINSHIEDLPNHLRSAVSLAKSKDASINWDKLVRDLKDWDSEDKRVQKRWMKDFILEDKKEETSKNKEEENEN